MWVFMLGLAGFPLTGGFVGKFYVFSAAYEAGWWWLVVVGVVATAVSLSYYLRVVRAMYMRPDPARRTPGLRRGGRRLAAARPAARGRRRRVPGGHGRLVLRRAAADRPRPRRGRVTAALAKHRRLLGGADGGPQGARGCGCRREQRWTAKSARQTSNARGADRGRRAVVEQRRADGRAEQEERNGDARERREHPVERLGRAPVEDCAQRGEGGERRERDGSDERVEGELVRAAAFPSAAARTRPTVKMRSRMARMFATGSDGPCRLRGMAANGTLTWLGHSAFRIDSPGGKRIYIDPFLHGNPTCPEAEQEPERVDLIALTHGHDDHVGDTVALAKRFSCPVLAQVELRGWLSTQGPLGGHVRGVQQGRDGRARRDLGHADRRQPLEQRLRGRDVQYLGESCGLVVELEDGFTIYFAGDTSVFGDMALIAPDLRARPRGAADRRPLHDGPARGGGRARAARGEALCALPLRHVPAAHRHARQAARAGA